MNKKLLSIVLIAVIVGVSIIIFIPSKNNLDSSTKNKDSIDSNIIDSNSPGVNDEKYTINDLEITKQISVEFAKLIYSVDAGETLRFSEQAVEFTTETLKERILEVAKIEPKEVYKRDVESVDIIESKYDEREESLMWNVEVYANVFDESGKLINKEKSDINILFLKENGVYKVSEYSIEKKDKK